MKKLFPLIVTVLLAAACGGKASVYKGSPAVELSLVEVSHTSATLLVQSVNSDAVYLLCTLDSTEPGPEEVIADGRIVEPGTVVLSPLSVGCSYHAYALGVQGEERSKLQRVDFVTGVLADDLYPWEKARGDVPSFADITLCSGGGRPNNNAWFSIPSTWDAARFAPHVSFTDDSGEHWLFDAFLSITGIDMDGRTYGINPNGARSADKASWEALASYWLDKGGAFEALDEAIDATASRIGMPPRKRYVVMVAPDPIMFEYFSDKNSSTSYWGAVDGRMLDFSRIDDQIAAYEWYFDLCREKFNALHTSHLELAGFYVLSEELVARTDGWNYRYKRWDRILPPVSEYLHARNEGLYWIPYRKADGVDLWKELGFDVAWLQPNYYWDYTGDMPIAEAFAMMKKYGMGMELEFEYSMVEEVMTSVNGIMGPDGAGRYVFSAKDVESLRGRLREYMQGFKDNGFYGKYPIALYSGSNAMWQLGTSKNSSDIAMYRELCQFIAGNPLKK
ncbi:MAG: DUF4855 domain-containing protein [Bacteroidales bacterium]|nr:DUF4855 domain-containing protein [Bacteroidales bacterium]